MQAILRQINNQKIFLLLISVIFLTAFLLIAWPFYYYFQNDEFGHLPIITEGKFIFSSLPRPLAEFSLYLDYKIWGLQPFGYHITNLIVHITNCVLLYHFSLLMQPGETGNAELKKAKAWTASVIFLFYVCHSEPIFWIKGIDGSLAGLFVLLSLIFYLKRHKTNWNIFLSLLFFLCGLLSYETSWIILLAVPFIFSLKLSSRNANLKKERIVISLFWLLFAFYIVWRIYRVGSLGGSYAYGNVESGNLLLLFENFNRLIARSLLPPMQSTILFIFCYALILGAFSLYTIYCFRRKQNFSKKNIAYLILFLAALLPAISIGIDTHDSEGERFIYVASIFLILLMVEFLFIIFKKINYKFWVALTTFIGFHFYLFTKTARDYELAGKMIKETINCAKKYNTKVQRLYAINIPTQLNGALMFRNSFSPALKWLAPGLQFKELQVIQPVELHEGYKIKCKKIHYEQIKEQLDQFNILFDSRNSLIIWFTRENVYFIQ